MKKNQNIMGGFSLKKKKKKFCSGMKVNFNPHMIMISGTCTQGF